MSVAMIALLSFAPSALITAQSRPLDPAPSGDVAAARRIDWLAANPDHTAFADQLDAAIESANTLDELERIADDVLPGITDPHLLAAVARRLGRVSLMARAFHRAANLFETAFVASGGEDLPSLFAEAQALLQTGEIVAAEQRARTVVARSSDYELKRRAYALIARSLHLRGRNEEAERLLATLAELDDPEFVEPDTLLLRIAVLTALGESADPASTQLVRLHPQSVAVSTASSSRVAAMPLPLTLYSPPTATVSSPVAEAEENPTSASVTAIQVGSFSDPDNAMHLAEDLSELGLDATAEKVDRDGRTLHLVMVHVPEGTSREASRILGVLRDAGYDGFLIY